MEASSPPPLGPLLPAVRRSPSPPPQAGPQEIAGMAKYQRQHALSSSAGRTRFLRSGSPPRDMVERLESRQHELTRLTRFTPSPSALAAASGAAGLPGGVDPGSPQAEMLRFGSGHLSTKPKPLPVRKQPEPVTPPADPVVCQHCGRGGETEHDDASSKWSKRQDVAELRRRVQELERTASVAGVAADYERRQQQLALAGAKREADEARAAQQLAEHRLRAEQEAADVVKGALDQAHNDKARFLQAMSPYSKGAEAVELLAISDELVAREKLKGQAKVVAALRLVVLAKKDTLALQYDLAHGRADPRAADAAPEDAALRAPTTDLSQELEANFSERWVSCGKPWRACGVCELCLEGGSLSQTREAAREYKAANQKDCQHLGVDDLVAARSWTRASPTYKAASPFSSDGRVPISCVINAVCREMQEPDRPPQQYASMYSHLRNAVMHLRGAAEGEILYRGQSSTFGQDYAIGDIVTWKAFCSTSKVDTKPREYARGGKMEQQGAAGKEAAEQAEQEEEDRGVLFVILGEHQSNLGAAILGNGSGSGSAATALVGGGLSDEPSSPNAFSRPFSDGGGGGTSASASAGGAAEAAVLSPPLAVASPDRDESEILLPPGSSFLVVDDAMEKDDASTTMTKTTQQRQGQGHRRTTLLRVVTLLHIGSWMDAQLFKQFPAVEQAKRQLAVAVQEQRGAQQLWQFLWTQVEVAAVAAGMAPTPEAVQEIISETPSEVVVRTGGEYYTVDMASGQVFFKEQDGGHSVVGTWDADTRRVNLGAAGPLPSGTPQRRRQT